VLPDGEFSGPPPPLRCAEQIASVACRQAGLRLIPTRKALQVGGAGRGLRMPCHYCGRCMLGCDVGAIFTTPNTLLPRALATGRHRRRWWEIRRRVRRSGAIRGPGFPPPRFTSARLRRGVQGRGEALAAGAPADGRVREGDRAGREPDHRGEIPPGPLRDTV